MLVGFKNNNNQTFKASYGHNFRGAVCVFLLVDRKKIVIPKNRLLHHALSPDGVIIIQTDRHRVPEGEKTF